MFTKAIYMSNQNLLSSDLRIDEVCHMHLKETAKWTKFLAIVGFVITGIIVLVALFAGSILAEMPVSETAGVGAGLVTFIYIIIAVIYFLLVIASREPAFAWISPVLEFRGLGPHVLGQLLIWIALILTVVSGLSYLWKNRKLLADC